MLLYLLLHVMFLSAAPMDATGRIEIGYVVAEYSFGVSAAKVIGVILSLLLVSTISAMLLAGPRALYVIGRDFSAFRWLGQENRYSVPANAVVLQITLTLLLIVTSTFDSIIIFSGAILALNSLVTVLGVWVLRMREPDLPRPFKVPLYPLPLIVFAALSLWTCTFNRTASSRRGYGARSYRFGVSVLRGVAEITNGPMRNSFTLN